jgi:tRNA pseudouridine13 synthase
MRVPEAPTKVYDNPETPLQPTDPAIERLHRWAFALPFATDGEPVGGALRTVPEDFRVDEAPAYSPSGEGDHLFVRFRKRNLDTRVAVERLAAALGVPAKDAGWAGLKDRRAVTTQWASFLFGDPAKLEAADLGDDLEVLEAARHGNKLRTGHLRGNRFRLRLRGSRPGVLEEARRRLGQLAATGLPHYFGEQRFGREGQNLERAHRWLVEGRRAPRSPFQRKLLASAWQSALFNALLAERVRDGELATVRVGDLARTERGGLFVFGPEDDAERAARFEITATGPIFGAKMRWPEGAVRAREEALLAEAGGGSEQLARFKRQGPGARRPYRIRLEDPEVEEDDDGLVLAFGLPAGAYATVVVRELTR